MSDRKRRERRLGIALVVCLVFAPLTYLSYGQYREQSVRLSGYAHRSGRGGIRVLRERTMAGEPGQSEGVQHMRTQRAVSFWTMILIFSGTALAAGLGVLTWPLWQKWGRAAQRLWKQWPVSLRRRR